MRATLSGTGTLLAGIGVLAVVAGACRPARLPPGTLPGLEVTFDVSSLPEDKRKVFAEREIATYLDEAIRRALLDQGRDPGSMTLQLVVTKFRFRSSGLVAIGGMMAGSDVIEVDASITRNGDEVARYTTGAATILPGRKRFDRLIEEAAERIVAGFPR